MGAHGKLTYMVPADIIYNGFLIGVWVAAVVLTLFLFWWAYSTFTGKFRPRVEVQDEFYTGKEELHRQVWNVTDLSNLYGWWHY